MTPVFFLSLLALVCDALIIDIDVAEETIDVRHSIPTNVITDEERKTFGIEDAALKRAVETYTNDKTKPDDVYVINEGNDLYSEFDWLEVKRTVTPKYLNLNPVTDCNPVPSLESEMTIETNWTGDVISVTDKVKHIIYSNGTVLISAENDWGKNVIIQKPIAVDEKEKGYEYAKCVMKVTLEYEATINGDIAADYNYRRSTANEGSHYFWAYELKDVQNAAKLKKKAITTEIITVIYYKKTKKEHIKTPPSAE